MTAIDTLSNIIDTNLSIANLKYCFVTENKCPIKIDGQAARPNHEEDFVELNDLLQCENIDFYAGVGISIQASKVSAIDVDHCFSEAFDINSADERAKDILSRFKEVAYCEFSFSGKGLRVLFKCPLIENYSDTYYIKNENKKVEFYQPGKSYRYVTLTGRAIYDNIISNNSFYISDIVEEFLEDYMKKPERKSFLTETRVEENKTFEQLLVIVKRLYFKDMYFQDLWFAQAPGSGKNESELDYSLLVYLFEHVTQNEKLLKQLFENSPYFKSKDIKHLNKWHYQNFRYYKYVYFVIRRNHI